MWAAKADRVEAIGCSSRSARGSTPTVPRHAARVGGGERPRRRDPPLVELGADPNQRGTFGGPGHGEGVTALHLAAQAGQREAVDALLELGADPLRDELHGGDAAGWAEFGCHPQLADLLP